MVKINYDIITTFSTSTQSTDNNTITVPHQIWLIIPILAHFGYHPVLSHFRFGLLVLASVCMAASGYVINDYFDIKIDRINRPEKMVIDNGLQRRAAMFFHVILSFIGVFVGLFISYIARKETWALMFLLIPVFLWYYSTTFKKQGFIGNMIVAGLTALVTIVVVSLEFAMLVRVHGAPIINSEACSTAWFWTLGFAFFAFVTTYPGDCKRHGRCIGRRARRVQNLTH
ncbi:UbiA family prenyltransferase [Saccharicrinis fermentans]|uniref:UbiA family prenyltransferase n=1 Tax=Saccharicrinis fermentans TaxID=982 RepID=UPI0004BA74B7|nr:UbiA family prenyltransferase [Saccharicrinis fermentans]